MNRIALVLIGLAYSCVPTYAAESAMGPGCDSPEAAIQLYNHLDRFPLTTPMYVVLEMMADYRQQGLMCEWITKPVPLTDMGEVAEFTRLSDGVVMSVIKWVRPDGSLTYSWRVATGDPI